MAWLQINTATALHRLAKAVSDERLEPEFQAKFRYEALTGKLLMLVDSQVGSHAGHYTFSGFSSELTMHIVCFSNPPATSLVYLGFLGDCLEFKCATRLYLPMCTNQGFLRDIADAAQEQGG